MTSLILHSISPVAGAYINRSCTSRNSTRLQYFSCQASSGNSSSSSNNDGSNNNSYAPPAVASWMVGYDLYELLGVERSSTKSDIKAAYRALQKRCHPDVAGAPGHDMAIVLNEVYSLLSDPVSRFAYDQELAKQAEFQGYTGKPLYSTWFGPQNEDRAVFVDEIKCVGCLKCALFASKTFAVESVYGRARVVGQWADTEDKIFDAIQTCPVDCISMVERKNLAALEFLMSKQPRGNVSMAAGNTAGVRVSNIFVDVNKFQSRFHEMKDRASTRESKEPESHEGRNSAVQGIRSISNWLYWTPFRSPKTSTGGGNIIPLRLPPGSRTSGEPLAERLQEAAAARRESEAAAGMTSTRSREDYWTPLLNPPAQSAATFAATSPSKEPRAPRRASITNSEAKTKRISIDLRSPLAMAVLSAAIVATGQGGEITGSGGLNEHIGGATALGVVNSFELRVILAGITWFVIGLATVGVMQVIGLREDTKR